MVIDTSQDLLHPCMDVAKGGLSNLGVRNKPVDFGLMALSTTQATEMEFESTPVGPDFALYPAGTDQNFTDSTAGEWDESAGLSVITLQIGAGALSV
jgi:hypothetical protein